ncbi:hypothetical protein N7G274_003348 [Stereocaulon virgatum]|uniref:Killer toxin Kp4 domain-containing protein n=1 Tax=Stereocaulon virgatum TaxID=373712 RepID=A0ABR4ADK1_9LECA
MGLEMNCRGTSECRIHQTETDDGLYRIAQFIDTTIDNKMYYDDGTKIACLPGAWDQDKGNGGLCGYLQNAGNATGDQLKSLVQRLQEHGCKKQGSIPTLLTIEIKDVPKGGLA